MRIIYSWNDSKFDVNGVWESLADPIQACIFNSVDGCLNWNCFQPASKVCLTINNKIVKGRGYAEQLILTALPWKIPMNELRWGRFGSKENNMVWIELREEDKQQWVWLNGEKIENCIR